MCVAHHCLDINRIFVLPHRVSILSVHSLQ